MTANLLNLDVDKVFEQHNVSEIEVINRKIQTEIENKREELRMMVRSTQQLLPIIKHYLCNLL